MAIKELEPIALRYFYYEGDQYRRPGVHVSLTYDGEATIYLLTETERTRLTDEVRAYGPRRALDLLRGGTLGIAQQSVFVSGHPSGDAADLRVQHPKRRSLFESCAFFVPKAIREPWYGDLCEDRERMRREGRSRPFIFAATLSQFIMLLVWWVKDTLLNVVGPFS